MITYVQIEAIHEAMREFEDLQSHVDPSSDWRSPSVDIADCFSKIRAALAGEKASDDGSP